MEEWELTGQVKEEGDSELEVEQEPCAPAGCVVYNDSGHIFRYNPSSSKLGSRFMPLIFLLCIIHVLEAFFCTGDVLGFLCLNHS